MKKENSITSQNNLAVITFLLLVVISIAFKAEAQQNPIKSFDGIPIVTYVRGVDSLARFFPIAPTQYDTIRNAGIKFIQVEDLKDNVYRSHLQGKGLMILPEQYFFKERINNYITYYTEARYTEWPTVGTDTADGKATLKKLETHTEKFGGVLRTKTTGTPLSHDTIVYGPQYWQDVRYRFHNQNDTIIKYIARFRLKLENLIPQNQLQAFSINDTICILLVTAKDTYVNSQFVSDMPVYVIERRVITYGDLLPLNNDYKTFDILYKLDEVPDSISDSPIVGNSIPFWQKNISGKENSFAAVKNIEFRVVWKSNSEIFRLYMDTIKVFDDRGYDLITDYLTQEKIISQVNFAPYRDSVAGWMSVDEPMSIDQMAPLRKVNELIESVQPNTGLWVNYNGSWNGRFDDANDPGYTMSLVRFDELMRRVKKANIWVVMNPFDWPYCPDSIPNYKVVNLKYVDSVLSKLAKAGNNHPNLFYGLCYQTGNYKDTNFSSQRCSREIEDYEFLYLSNLALLYGSKVLTPWQWFGISGGGNGIYTGIVNYQNGVFKTTEKYSVIKYKLAPRLSGLMGKTLKRLEAKIQYPGINLGNINKEFIQSIDEVIPSNIELKELDLGFFNDHNSMRNERYFMLISRYYNSIPILNLKIKFNPNYFTSSPYNNYNIRDYITSYCKTKLRNNLDTILVTIPRGDAVLIGINPVVKSGGTLIADETTQLGETLHEDMTITNNATLTVNGDYYANANIILKDGGKIIAGQNGKIIFSSGKRLIIEGNSEVKGSESNRLRFVFNNSRSGIKILSQGSLNISYCDIEGGDVAIQSETNQYVKISNIIVNGSASAGIFITSGQEQGNSPVIENSLITNCPTGITIIGTDEIVIKGNEIKQCNNGLMMINVNSAYVSGNQIDGENNLAGVGIYLQNTGGYLRANTIKRHASGIHLSYSSPDIGANTIEHNKNYGIYVGVGSIPDLRKRLENPSCWYPISGCNIIRENGIGEPTNNINIEGVGSEIYIEKSDIRISYGENEISDDREYVPTHLAIPLITGRLSNDGNLAAEGNYWGVVGDYVETKKMVLMR